jgi:hypothetical protein
MILLGPHDDKRRAMVRCAPSSTIRSGDAMFVRLCTAGLLILALAACTRVYTTPPGGGPLQFNSAYLNLPWTGERQVVPPLPPGTAYGHDGLYAGDAQALNSLGAVCPEFLGGGGFRVEGRHVSFGQFSGTIGPNGDLTMIYGHDSVVGRFIGDEFRGVLSYQALPLSQHPPCSYAIVMRRVGPA